MADIIQTELSITQDLKEAEERLRELGSVISNVTNLSCLDELNEQMIQLEGEIDKKFKSQKNVTSTNQHVVQELEAKSESLALKIDSYKKSINLLQDEKSQLLTEKTLLKNVPEGDIMTTKIKQLETENSMYQKHLGLEIRKVKGGCIQFAFSQIDHKQPNSLFLFSLRLDENRQYIVTDCKPNIPDMDEIVTKLNADNDFRKFVHTMRKRFKDGVA